MDWDCSEKGIGSHEQISESPRTDNAGLKKIPILYASDVPIERAKFKITSSFEMTNFGTLLDVVPSKVPGVSNPFLYFGLQRSSFAWHTEDMQFFSINYLHYGAPCIW